VGFLFSVFAMGDIAAKADIFPSFLFGVAFYVPWNRLLFGERPLQSSRQVGCVNIHDRCGGCFLLLLSSVVCLPYQSRILYESNVVPELDLSMFKRAASFLLVAIIPSLFARISWGEIKNPGFEEGLNLWEKNGWTIEPIHVPLEFRISNPMMLIWIRRLKWNLRRRIEYPDGSK